MFLNNLNWWKSLLAAEKFCFVCLVYTCREKIVVPADKPFITLSGAKASDTIITWNDGGGIFDSPTLSVLASDFVGRYLTIQVLLKICHLHIYIYIYK